MSSKITTRWNVGKKVKKTKGKRPLDKAFEIIDRQVKRKQKS